LIHITGIATQQATIAAMNYAAGIATHVINNLTPPISFQGIGNSIAQVKNPSVIAVPGGCVGVGTTIRQLVGIITSMIGAGSTLVAPPIRYGVNLESNDCADDIKDIWKCIIHDITRGGNSRSVDAGSAYYDKNNNLIPQGQTEFNYLDVIKAASDRNYGEYFLVDPKNFTDRQLNDLDGKLDTMTVQDANATLQKAKQIQENKVNKLRQKLNELRGKR
jgi:hypothetical protein